MPGTRASQSVGSFTEEMSAALDAKLAQHFAAFNATISALTTQIAALESSITQKDSRICDLEERVEQRDARINDLEERVDQLDFASDCQEQYGRRFNVRVENVTLQAGDQRETSDSLQRQVLQLLTDAGVFTRNRRF